MIKIMALLLKITAGEEGINDDLQNTINPESEDSCPSSSLDSENEGEDNQDADVNLSKKVADLLIQEKDENPNQFCGTDELNAEAAEEGEAETIAVENVEQKKKGKGQGTDEGKSKTKEEKKSGKCEVL